MSHIWSPPWAILLCIYILFIALDISLVVDSMKRTSSCGRFFEQVRDGDKKIVVIKIGTSSLMNPTGGTLAISNLARICEMVKSLKESRRAPSHSLSLSRSVLSGCIVLLVSSGAIGVGCQQLHLTARPSAIGQKQACAAIGQLHLMRYYSDFFSSLGMVCLPWHHAMVQ